MTILCYEKENNKGTIASISQEKFCSDYILFICDSYGRTIKKSRYFSIKSAKQAGNRIMQQIDNDNTGKWNKSELWSIYGGKNND